MKEDIKIALESVGLSDKEIKVYTSLLELGSSPVSKITERTELVRVTVYPVIKTLIEKGFVTKFSMDKKSNFKAINPQQILDKIKEKEDKIKMAMPSLKDMMNKIEHITSVELFKGKKGISSFFEKLYSGDDKELWAYGNGELIDNVIKYQSMHARKLRINKKIKLNIVVSPIKTDYIKDSSYKEITKIKFNEKLTGFNIYIVFGKRLVGIIDLTKEINAVMIDNEEIAKYHKFVYGMFI